MTAAPLRLLAPAKLNLYLSVGPRRSDGYHELVSVMQAVSLADEVTLAEADAPALTVEPPGAAPEGDENLALRAARALAAAHGRAPAVSIRVAKTIPAAAGLGGGSADAAAALVGCNRLWGLGVSRKALEKLGAALGADVPFCIRGGTVAARGIGEDMSSLPVARALWWVLGLPEGALSTRAVYDEHDRLGGGALGDPFEVADALARGDLDRLAGALHNDLARAAAALAPAVARGGDAFREAGALGAVLSGSGPSWCGLARDEAHARDIAARVAGAFARVEVVHSVEHGARALAG